MEWRRFAKFAGIFTLGLVAGGVLFSRSIPRSFLAVTACQGGECLQPNEIAGLLGSVGFQLTPGLTPRAIKETQKSIVVEWQPGWIVVFPKRDIKNAAQLSEEDQTYVLDAYAAMGELIRERGMRDWQIFTNGPGIQHLTYLHFHLIDRTATNMIPTN